MRRIRFVTFVVVVLLTGLVARAQEGDLPPLWVKGSDTRAIPGCSGLTLKRSIDKSSFPKGFEDRHDVVLRQRVSNSNVDETGPEEYIRRLCQENDGNAYGIYVTVGAKTLLKRKLLAAMKKEIKEVQFGYRKPEVASFGSNPKWPAELRNGVLFIWFSEENEWDLTSLFVEHFVPLALETSTDPERTKLLPWEDPKREADLAAAMSYANGQCGTRVAVSYDKTSFDGVTSTGLQRNSGTQNGCIDAVRSIGDLCAGKADKNGRYWAKAAKEWIAPVKKIECRWAPLSQDPKEKAEGWVAPYAGALVRRKDTLVKYMPAGGQVEHWLTTPSCVEPSDCSTGLTCDGQTHCQGGKGTPCNGRESCLSGECSDGDATDQIADGACR